MNATEQSHRVVIVGGGAAGITTAAVLVERQPDLDIALIEPSDTHYAKAIWPLVGAGVHEAEATRRSMGDVTPKGVRWIQNSVRSIDPDATKIELEGGASVRYEFLVVCAGVESTWGEVPGLESTIGSNAVCSVYSLEYAAYTWETLKVLESGNVLFVVPASPFRCAGSTFELMFLAADNLEQRGRLDRTPVGLFTPDRTVSFNPLIDGPLEKIMGRYDIDVHRGHRLVEVDGTSSIAVFESMPDQDDPKRVEQSFDMLHVVPGRRPPEFVSTSKVSTQEGWLDVDPGTLRNPAYANVFGAGDVIGGSFLRSVFGIIEQARVVASNLTAAIKGDDRLASCSGKETLVLSTAYGRAMKLRFDEPIGSARKTDVSTGSDGLLTYWKFKKSLPRRYWRELLKGRG